MNSRTSDLKFNTVMGTIFTFLTVFNATFHLTYAYYLDGVIAAVHPGSNGHHVIEAMAFTLIFESFAIALLVAAIHALYVRQCELSQFPGQAFAPIDISVAA
ncbi:MAG: hypothetical protein JWN75_404 [Candidatus Saccharibacteria bacterium]|nr:hypothetical protein [Candidatus Saccharibacteria bacterium]